MKTVITYGTFDLFHPGHLALLKKAKELGNYLIVGLSTDEFAQKKKFAKPIYSYDERYSILSAIKFVDTIIPENSWEQKKEDIQKYDVDVLISGANHMGNYDELKDICQVYYVPIISDMSDSTIKARIFRREE